MRLTTRRTFTVEDKLRVLRAADLAVASGRYGAIRDLLEREGLRSSHLQCWRRERERGALAGLTPKKRGRKRRATPLASASAVARLQRDNARLEARLRHVEEVIAEVIAARGDEDELVKPGSEPRGDA